MSANIFQDIRGSTRHKKMLRHRREYTFELNKAERQLASSILRRASGPLLEGDESRAVRGSDTGPTMLHRLVGDGELSQVVSNHFGLHLNLCEELAVVNSKNGYRPLGDNDHVPEVGLDHVGLLVGGSLLLLLPQLLDQGHWLPLESPGEL